MNMFKSCFMNRTEQIMFSKHYGRDNVLWTLRFYEPNGTKIVFYEHCITWCLNNVLWTWHNILLKSCFYECVCGFSWPPEVHARCPAVLQSHGGHTQIGKYLLLWSFGLVLSAHLIIRIFVYFQPFLQYNVLL